MDGAATPPDAAEARDAPPPSRECLDALAAALGRRGLTVRVGAGGLVARNPAASQTDDPRGRGMNPGLFQYVALSGGRTGHRTGSGAGRVLSVIRRWRWSRCVRPGRSSAPPA